MTYITADSTLFTADSVYVLADSSFLIRADSPETADSLLITADGYKSINVRSLTAEPYVFTWSGQSINIYRHRIINSNHSGFTLAGVNASLLKHLHLENQSGSYSVNGSVLSASITYKYPPPSLVAKGVLYGENGELVGEFIDKSLKIELNRGYLIKPLSTNTVISL